MIESGSHHPGVDVDGWRVPAGTAVRYERPAAALRPLLSAYAVHDSDPAVFPDQPSWVLGTSPRIWITLSAPDLRVKLRKRRPATLDTAMLVGPTSVAMPLRSSGGVSVVIEPTPSGWARLFAPAAASLRDRMVPLEENWPAEWTVELLASLHSPGPGTGVKPALDAFFLDRDFPPSKHEPLIVRIQSLAAQDAPRLDVTAWPAAAGIGSASTLARLCDRCFGFSPKLLQRRSRFMRAFAPMLLSAEPIDFGAVPAGYHDVPHFLRDARHFLGMTAKQFLDMPIGYLSALLRARAAVIGSPLAVLDVT